VAGFEFFDEELGLSALANAGGAQQNHAAGLRDGGGRNGVGVTGATEPSSAIILCGGHVEPLSKKVARISRGIVPRRAIKKTRQEIEFAKSRIASATASGASRGVM
jgi:hypothetical protein